MNSRRNRLYLLAALILAGCTAGERRVVTIQRHWPASGIRTIEVEGVDGSLSVEAGSSEEVTLVAHVRSVGIDPKQEEENSGYFETDVSGDTLRIAQQRARRHVSFPFLFRNNLTIDYELRVPATVALDMKMINGRIVSRGV